jgi:peptidyl-prolyl cis-trans isomerase D
VRDKGEPTLDAIEPALRRDLMNDKKAKRITSSMTGKSLVQLAKSLNMGVMKGDITFGSPQIPSAGYEPEVVGMLFGGLKDGQSTLPIKGQAAVYVVRIDKTTKPVAAINYKQEKETMTGAAKSNMQTEAINALRERAEVLDNRRLFRIGVRR